MRIAYDNNLVGSEMKRIDSQLKDCRVRFPDPYDSRFNDCLEKMIQLEIFQDGCDVSVEIRHQN